MILNLKPPDETPMEPLSPFWCYVILYAQFAAWLVIIAVVGAAVLEWVR